MWLDDVWRMEHPQGSILDEIILQLEADNIVYANVIAPYFVSSIACHILSLYLNDCAVQIDGEFGGFVNPNLFMHGGERRDMRLHILFVAPPGFGKSMYLRKFLWELGYVNNTYIPCTTATTYTEAALVGTVNETKKDFEIVYGDLYKYSKGIIGCEEADSLIGRGLDLDYNANLLNILLTALDKGIVSKNLRNGKIAYKTNATLWFGTQPGRCELGAGLARRFLLVKFSPTITQIHNITQACLKSTEQVKDVSNIKTRVETVRHMINDFYKSLCIREIVFSERYKLLRSKLNIPHTELDNIDKLAVGYNLMTSFDVSESEVVVDVSPQLEQLIRFAIISKYKAIMANVESDVLNLLIPKQPYDEWQITFLCVKYLGLTASQANKIIAGLKSSNLLRYYKDPTNISAVKYYVEDNNIIDKWILQYLDNNTKQGDDTW